jgi:hypothetical protein
MDNMLIITGFIAAFSIALMLWDLNAKRLNRRHKKDLRNFPIKR